MTFRLCTLMLAMGVFAVGCFLLVVAPPQLAVPGLVTIWLILTAWLLAGTIYGRGRARAFCIGAMIPAGGTATALVWLLWSWLLSAEPPNLARLLEYFDRAAFAFRLWSASGWLLTGILGLTCMAGRAALRRSGD